MMRQPSSTRGSGSRRSVTHRLECSCRWGRSQRPWRRPRSDTQTQGGNPAIRSHVCHAAGSTTILLMELGLYSFAETHPDPVTGHQVGAGQRLRNLIEEIELADQVGLDVYG